MSVEEPAGAEAPLPPRREKAMGETILACVAAVIVILLVLVATRPASFHVERSITVSAPPSAVLRHLADFRAWAAWSPYDKIDPSMTRAYEGAPSGVGARYAWSGNAKAGKGTMAIEKCDASAVVIALHFDRPFEADNTATFTLTPTSMPTRDGAPGETARETARETTVTWAMDGVNGFTGKAFSLVVNMDKLVGGDFERGLASLKGVVEATGTVDVVEGPGPTACAL